jgi:response regulator RpfG family c-di-GMP phosphodiesterase
MASVRYSAPARPDEGLDRLGEVSQSPTVESAVEAVREVLGMEVAYATEFVDGQQVFQHLTGDGESFGVAEGTTMPLDQTYCQRVLDGRLPNIIPDVRADDRAASLPITEAADVGSFVSVPLVLSDGEVHGTLCAASHQANPALGYRELRFMHVFARIVADQLEREQLERRTESVERVARRLELEATSAMAVIAAVQARDSYTADHSWAVVDSAVEVARRLGLDAEETAAVKQVALLHDIGKIAVPDQILNKPGPLTEEERPAIERHPLIGEGILSPLEFLADAIPLVRAAHERWDGSGYPDGLAGEEIPLGARILFACDAYEAMLTERPYRPALSRADAEVELRRVAGSQLDPHVVEALIETLDGDS